jgi:hypothetical protein
MLLGVWAPDVRRSVSNKLCDEIFYLVLTYPEPGRPSIISSRRNVNRQ